MDLLCFPRILTKRFPTGIGFMFTAVASMMLLAGADSEKNPRPLFSDKAQKIVYFVPQFSEFKEISEIDRRFLKNILKRAEQDNVKAVIFEMDTPGGRVDIAMRYISILNKSEIPTIAFLNPKGISAGMIVALGANRIAIHPDGLIGDAMPIAMSPSGPRPVTERPAQDEKLPKKNKEKNDQKQDDHSIQKIIREFQKSQKDNRDAEDKRLSNQKFLTVFFKELEVQAQRNQRPVRVIRAMADPYQQLTKEKDGIDFNLDRKRSKPLTLSAAEAKRLRVVDQLCRNKREVMQAFGLADCRVVVREHTFIQQIAFFLAHPAVSALLIMLGILGIYTEIRTPGFGIPGILGLTALTLYFLGKVAVGDANWGPPVVFVVGVILLLIEMLVIPGFGIVGVMGIICMLIGLFWGFGVQDIKSLYQAIYWVGGSLVMSILLVIFLTLWVLPKIGMVPLFHHLTLDTEQITSKGYSSFNDDRLKLTGLEGIAYTTLRPAGTAIIENKRYDVVTRGDFIEKGAPVKVVHVEGAGIVVEKIS